MIIMGLLLAIDLGVGFGISAMYLFWQKWFLSVRILSQLKKNHERDVKEKYNIEPSEDAIFKYSPLLGSSMKFLIPGFVDWKFWTGPRPSWIWEFMDSDEDFGDVTLRDLKHKYQHFNWRRFTLAGATLSVLFFAGFLYVGLK